VVVIQLIPPTKGTMIPIPVGVEETYITTIEGRITGLIDRTIDRIDRITGHKSLNPWHRVVDHQAWGGHLPGHPDHLIGLPGHPDHPDPQVVVEVRAGSKDMTV
jgi:hypothetical protein